MSDAVNITRGWGLLEGLLARERANKANALISKAFRQGKILDIGCGSFPYFLTTINFKQKYGVDPSLNSLSVDDINLQRLDVAKQKLPFKNAFFDVVTMLAVFEHIEHNDLMPVIKGIYRILKKGGLLIITTPAPWSDKLLHQMAKVGLISAEEIHEHKHNHSKERIEDIIGDGGFSQANIRSGFFELGMNMWFVAKK